MSFLIGFWFGAFASAVGVIWALLSPRGEKTVIDRWWLGNEDRWLDLRKQLLREQNDDG